MDCILTYIYYICHISIRVCISSSILEVHHHNHHHNDNDNNNHTFIIVSSDSYPHLPDDVKDRYSDIIVAIQRLGICLHKRKVIPYNPFLLFNQTRLVLRSADKRMKNTKIQRVHLHTQNDQNTHKQ